MEKNKTKTTSTDGRVKEEETQVSEVAKREEDVLAFWRDADIFNKSLEKDAPNGEFVFYDGPPFATGLPHYGHILAGTIKDAIPRFWTMRGYRVRRKWGWDCHGLPIENLIEKRLGLASKRDIEEFGIQKFNEAARGAVLEYADDWRRIIPRMGRFVDMEDDYKTMDSSYTESVWWVFKSLYEKGLVYEGFKSMHLSPRSGTTLSNFEVNLGYKDIKDIAVTVKLPLLDDAGNTTDTSLLVWTTTPWTLPGNMAAAVHKDHTYVKIRIKKEESGNENKDEESSGTECVILAKARLEHVGDISYDVVDEVNGSELVGRKYEPPFAYFKDRELEHKENAWTIYHADYVDVEGEGTGAVHLAPAYGEEDMELAKAHNIPIVHHVNYEGRFMDFVTDFAGQLVKPKDDDAAGVTHLDADIEIVKALNASGKLFKKENITHSYPHDWRNDAPLINYATTSWFIEVTKIRDALVSANKQVHWVPEHVGRARFGKWLEGARDWAVSRQRYWGAPLPVWRHPETDAYKIFGSLDELTAHTRRSGNRYTLMRHGQSESNVAHHISARAENDDPLTALGREQVETAAKALAEKPDLIIHSGFMRTRQTAELVAQTLGVPEEAVLEDARIGEFRAGERFEGRTWDEYSAFFGSWEAWYTKSEDGVENQTEVRQRVGEFIYEIDAKYQNRSILIVGHGGPLRSLFFSAYGMTVEESKVHNKEYGNFKNAETRTLDFVPLPHNDRFELDFHRPYIDAYPVVDEDGTALVRVPDVFDCWFESGAMPYAETHYPFEHLNVANPAEGVRFPADFIAESIDQTRGWFYSLMVLGVALFNKSPYDNVITNGLVLAEDGRKMSKSLQNYPDPIELVDRQGADTMRFYLLSSAIIKGEDLNFSEKEVQELQRKNIGRLHNVLSLYEMYADATAASDVSTDVLDRWILTRLAELVRDTTLGFEQYELDKATRPITDFIDDLSVWYVRRSRDRLKGDDVADRAAALGTLRLVLRELALVIAPSMPFYADYLYRRVRADDEPESVHLADWPEMGTVDGDILKNMRIVREVVSEALELRTKAGMKVRQPLASLTTTTELSAEYAALVRDEVNVKKVTHDAALEARVVLDTELTPELKQEGEAREFMRAVQDMRKMLHLAPADRVVLTIATDEGGREAIKEFEDEIKKTVGADEIAFAETVDGEVVAIGDRSYSIALSVLNA